MLGLLQCGGSGSFFRRLRSLTRHLGILFRIEQMNGIIAKLLMWCCSSNCLPLLQPPSLFYPISLRAVVAAAIHSFLCPSLRPVSSPSSAVNAYPYRLRRVSLQSIDPKEKFSETRTHAYNENKNDVSVRFWFVILESNSFQWIDCRSTKKMYEFKIHFFLSLKYVGFKR